MASNIKWWNNEILEEISELKFLIENEKANLQATQYQIETFQFGVGNNLPQLVNLLNQKDFILYSIQVLEKNVLRLRSRIIYCC